MLNNDIPSPDPPSPDPPSPHQVLRDFLHGEASSKIADTVNYRLTATNVNFRDIGLNFNPGSLSLGKVQGTSAPIQTLNEVTDTAPFLVARRGLTKVDAVIYHLDMHYNTSGPDL